MAQGAAQATEDAACLATCLAQYETLREALETYENRRKPRAAHIARNTRVLQEWWHLDDGPLKNKRDAAMRHDSDGNPMFWGYGPRRDWLFGHDARVIHQPIEIPLLPPEVDAKDSSYKARRLRALKAE